ncbi:DUF3667 domain-containing protein [Hymenobacter jeollabukensis]|uniref:DUF3667 domain-containing protein n=1 Tax=Hymenobacter jeollabukensis TaxID=2025313 RepID=A0A5R8WKN8_9BACT|nr:DUF3667 domain-containing protein [Hymenobacter jeollabukensis]TLM89123.1 DUF3667 domain-containing protein [Hymenobacter jeollabukensis]
MHSTLTSPVAAPAHTDHSHACLNCGGALSSRFCPDCGQPADTHRITMAHWVHDIPHSFWHVDKGVWFTLRSMFARPGAAIQAYIQGQRVNYFRPLALVLLVTGFYSFLATVLHISPLPPRPADMPQQVYEMQMLYAGTISKHISWIYVGMTPLLAAFMRLCMRRSRFNYAECLVAVAFVISASNFISVLFLPVLYAFNGTPQIQLVTTALSLTAFGYQTWAYSTLLRHTSLSAFGRIWRGLVTSVGGFFASIMLVVCLIIALNWSTFMAAAKAQNSAKARITIGQPAAPRPASAH